MALFAYIPWWLTIVFVSLTFVIVACGGHVLVKRSFPKSDFIVHNEVAGFLIAVVGVLYAVLLGFLTIVVWEQFRKRRIVRRKRWTPQPTSGVSRRISTRTTSESSRSTSRTTRAPSCSMSGRR